MASIEPGSIPYVSEARRAAAEEIRSYLVGIRGGAPFLSPSDTLLLIEWLDGGVSVADVLRALERASAARRARRSRVPFTLRHARRHLGKGGRGVFDRRRAPVVEVVGGGPLGRLVGLIRQRASLDPHEPQLLDLAVGLEQIPDGDRECIVRLAASQLNAFHQAIWRGLSDVQRREACAQALERVGDLVHLMDEQALAAIVEEGARDDVRQSYDWLSASTVWDLVTQEQH